ncbi:winged helix-turn-helix transcriptional regulator [Natronoglomus mannanivorans]|uniref:Winged helix-turn-helix transcriptional regulator n=1 Tax=Natronoglomus mannanivorans TaxID=2979990 RepID=A0AAP2Z492_9EURY|nr:winged helix-turn-helix transcriptional regulator [Halobacteria archaeon AArc-xg1-1]
MSYRDLPIPPNGRYTLEAIALLSKKWSPVVLLLLRHRGPQGFNDLLEGIPDISSRVLSDTLESLQEAGLIERHVVSESPLRVRYERTDAGREMDQIFEDLADWAASHLAHSNQTVLVADGDSRITEMYQQWVSDRYVVCRAHDNEEFAARLADGIDVALLDIGLPGIDIHKFVSRRPCRTVLIVGDQPDPALMSIECDDVLRKPFVRETALETIATQLDRVDESPEERERASLLARTSLLESIYSRIRLEDDETYCDLVARLEELDDST